MTNFDASLYSINVHKVIEDGDEYFEATVNELPDVSVFEDKADTAYYAAIDAIECLYKLACDLRKSFPEPARRQKSESFSGRVTLRLSKRLHAEVSQQAEQDGVSLNQWLCEAAAVRSGAGTLVDLYRSSVAHITSHAMNFLSVKSIDAPTQIGHRTDLTPFGLGAPAWRNMAPSQILIHGQG
ncbi:toxin-antitoxin system HicB family antitoxin [Achromobacter mucicolens]|uniref:toxin-antitoxin system HicB family antitoxin n=1 Tax=Achromobacter mucicolens TaxID=1389922 RepID=UPI003208207D